MCPATILYCSSVYLSSFGFYCVVSTFCLNSVILIEADPLLSARLNRISQHFLQLDRFIASKTVAHDSHERSCVGEFLRRGSI